MKRLSLSGVHAAGRPESGRSPSVARRLLLMLPGMLGFCGLLGLAPDCPAAPPDKHDPRRWEAEIERIEQRDRAEPPAPGGILFVGSSSIKRWDVKRDFPDLPVVNHGFGGSQIADSLYYADRIILPLKPRTVVLYAGDNDIASGKRPEQVRDDFRRLAQRIHETLPETRIVFLAIKPSLRRWEMVDRMREANRLIRGEMEYDDQLVYADVFTPMLGTDGRPRKDLFVEDGLHLSRSGYALWTKLLRPLLASAPADGDAE